VKHVINRSRIAAFRKPLSASAVDFALVSAIQLGKPEGASA